MKAFRYIAPSIAQLGDPRIRGVVFKTAALTLLVMIAMLAGAWRAAETVHVSQQWLHWFIDFASLLAAAILAAVLFGVIASIVVSFFLNDVADAVEARHYPWAGPARRQSMDELVREGLRFAGVSLLVNFLALPVYLFFPAINLFVFYGLNGYLLSREYFELVAFRRIAPPEARRLRLTHPAEMLLSGVLIAVILTIPVLNLVAPVLATAFMVHVYHGLDEVPRHQAVS